MEAQRSEHSRCLSLAANKWALPIPGSISIRPVDQRANQLGRRNDTARRNYSEKRRLWKFIRLSIGLVEDVLIL